MMGMKVLLSYIKMYYALHKISQAFLEANIRDANHVLTLLFNAGKAIVTQKGNLKGYGTVWYHPTSIANILSLHNTQKKQKVAYDSSMMTGFIKNKADGINHVFKPPRRGYYFLMLKVTLLMSCSTQ